MGRCAQHASINFPPLSPAPLLAATLAADHVEQQQLAGVPVNDHDDEQQLAALAPGATPPPQPVSTVSGT